MALLKMPRRRRRSDGQVANSAKMNSVVSNIDKSMKSLYADTYLSDRRNLDSLDYVSDKMEDNINAIIRRNNQYDISNVSRLYSRAMTANSSKNYKANNELKGEIESLFNDPVFTDTVMSAYLSNKWIADFDKEIDLLLKILPKMKEALEVLKDAVLSADSLSKDFIYPRVPISDDSELKIVTDRIDRMKTKYGLSRLAEDWYDLASYYGEAFVYIVPYNKAIERLLSYKEKNKNLSSANTGIIENGVINESVLGTTQQSRNLKLNSNCSLYVEIDTSRILSSCVEEAYTARKVVSNNSNRSIMESYVDELQNGEIVHEKVKFDKVIADDLEIPEGLNDNSSFSSSRGNNSTEDKVDVRGCVIKTLDRKNLIRLYVDDICIGYYYLEFKSKSDGEINYSMDNDRTLGYSKSVSSVERTIADNAENAKTDSLMRNIAMQLSDKIDATFVNTNQDLTKEIYAMLKYNDIFNSNTQVRVTYLPPEDVKWLRFREDKDLHVGISDLMDGLYPAKLLSMILMTYINGTMTRGQDKRVYYVKQTIETNISQTLLNVINQIKKSNFNMRSIENLNNLLNITGRFNDYIIPVGPSGDSPIQFEIMPGQDFNINQDLIDMLEEMAINPIAPLEVIQARMSPDFATQYTSASLKLLRKTYRRQARVELFLSEIYTDVYASEYGEYLQIDCELPPPVFLSMVNTTQLLDNTTQYVNAIAELEYAAETSDTAEQEKAIFIKKMIRGILSSYMKPGEIEKHKASAKFEVAKANTNNES